MRSSWILKPAEHDADGRVSCAEAEIQNREHRDVYPTSKFDEDKDDHHSHECNVSSMICFFHFSPCHLVELFRLADKRHDGRCHEEQACNER